MCTQYRRGILGCWWLESSLKNTRKSEGRSSLAVSHQCEPALAFCFATPFHSKRGAAELFLRRALRRAPWARNVSSCALWAPVVLGGNTFLELIVNTTCNNDVRFWQKNLKLWCWSCCYGIVTIFHKSSNIQWAETQEQQPTPCVVDFIFCVSVNGIFWSIVLYLWIVYCIFVCIQQACS